MLPLLAVAALAAVPATALTIQSANVTINNSTECAPVHMILGRGSTESYPGTLESLASIITKNNPEATYENIIYPAVDETTSDSYFVGRVAAANQLSAYAERCPESKIVVLGYSQGSLIISDALSGGGGGNGILGNNTKPFLSPRIGEHINSIILYGDPRHMPNQTYNYGNHTEGVTGKYPRADFQLNFLNKHYADKIHDYCNPNDPVCADGDDITAHEEYVYLWNYDAAAFVQRKLEGRF